MSFFKQIPECIFFIFIWSVKSFLTPAALRLCQMDLFLLFRLPGSSFMYFAAVKLFNALLTSFTFTWWGVLLTDSLVVCFGAVNAKISCSTVPCSVTEDNKQCHKFCLYEVLWCIMQKKWQQNEWNWPQIHNTLQNKLIFIFSNHSLVI